MRSFVVILLLLLNNLAFSNTRVGIVVIEDWQGILGEIATYLERNDYDATVFSYRSITGIDDLSSYDVLFLSDYDDATSDLEVPLNSIKEFVKNGGGIVSDGSLMSAILFSGRRFSETYFSEYLPYEMSGRSFEVFDFNRDDTLMVDLDHEFSEGFDPEIVIARSQILSMSPLDESTSFLNFDRYSIGMMREHNQGVAISLGVNPATNLNVTRDPVTRRLIRKAIDTVSVLNPKSTKHTCMKHEDGVRCWGSNRVGQLGQENSETRIEITPEDVANVSLGEGFEVREYAFRSDRSCALSEDNRLKCWGRGRLGTLGLESTENQGDQTGSMGDALAEIDLGTDFVIEKVRLGPGHSCAISDSGMMKCWGKNNAGQLGLGMVGGIIGDENGEMGDDLNAINLPDGLWVKDAALGRGHSCALLSDNSVRCWGANDFGQLGLGHTDSIGAEEIHFGNNLRAVSFGEAAMIAQIEAGDYSTCVRFANGKVTCWGRNNSGQLGVGSTDTLGDDEGEVSESYVLLGRGQAAADLSCSRESCCAVLAQGTMKCWGKNKSGQLGYGDANPRGGDPIELEFVPQTPLTTISQVEVFGEHTCALYNDGWRCWGANTHGQLGYGDAGQRGHNMETTPDLLPMLEF